MKPKHRKAPKGKASPPQRGRGAEVRPAAVLISEPVSPSRSLFLYLARSLKFLFASKLALVGVLLTLVIPISAFEAHVINVTATIERRVQCDALSIGYWRNHEGCSGGSGSSVWTSEVNALSATYSSVFAAYSGEQICENLWIPNCPSGSTYESKLCKAKAQTLADHLNVVSSRLDLAALIAGADDGSLAFDNLGLSYNSTVDEALSAVENVLATSSSTSELTDAAHVAERIYTFYEEENPDAPACVYTPQENPESWSGGGHGYSHEDDDDSYLEEDGPGRGRGLRANILESIVGEEESGEEGDTGGASEAQATTTVEVAATENATSTESAPSSPEENATSTTAQGELETPTEPSPQELAPPTDEPVDEPTPSEPPLDEPSPAESPPSEPQSESSPPPEPTPEPTP